MGSHNNSLAIAALVLIAGGALYIAIRWRRAPQARRALIGVAVSYLVAGLFLGAWAIHFVESRQVASSLSITSPPSAIPSNATPSGEAPMLNLNATPAPPGSVVLPALHYDPAHARRPDPKHTPGDVFPDATADDVCTPGWAKEHRHVTEADRARVYAEYPDSKRTCACAGGVDANCCEVDHLIPLELGGSNDIKNLWPEPTDPRPGDLEKDSLENDLHERVCKGEMSLADAQKCIASDWVDCWKKYVVPEYGPQWAAANRHGW